MMQARINNRFRPSHRYPANSRSHSTCKISNVLWITTAVIALTLFVLYARIFHITINISDENIGVDVAEPIDVPASTIQPAYIPKSIQPSPSHTPAPLPVIPQRNDAPCWANYSVAFNAGTRYTCRLIEITTHTLPSDGPPTRQCCCINLDHASAQVALALDDWKGALCQSRKRARFPDLKDNYGPALVCFPGVLVVGAQKAGTTALTAHFLRNDAYVPIKSVYTGRVFMKELHVFEKIQKASTPVVALMQVVNTMGDTLTSIAAVDGVVDDAMCENIRVKAPDVDARTNMRGKRFHVDETDAAIRAWQLLRNDAYTWQYLKSHFTVDSSPSYMLSSQTLRTAAAFLPHAHIIVMLREPIARAYSE